MHEFYGVQGSESTLEVCTFKWKKDQPLPTYEEILKKTTPNGYEVDRAVIAKYKEKNPNEDNFDDAGIERQAAKLRAGGTIFFVTAHKMTEKNSKLING